MKFLSDRLVKYSKGMVWLRAFIASFFVCAVAYLGLVGFNWCMEFASLFGPGSFSAALHAWPYFAIAFVVLFFVTYALEKLQSRRKGGGGS
jgi:hypothetical protein